MFAKEPFRLYFWYSFVFLIQCRWLETSIDNQLRNIEFELLTTANLFLSFKNGFSKYV